VLHLAFNLYRVPFCDMTSLSRSLVVAVLALVITGCASSGAPTTDSAWQPTVSSQAADYESTATRAQLDALWMKRGSDASGADVPIGPGDILRISIPGMDEMTDANNDVSVRVGGDGKIKLPLIGTVQAGGLTQDQLASSLRERFGYYMYNPPVRLFVTEYHSREVGVFGAVAKPGLYDIIGPTETIQTMIAAAGGMSDAAAQHIQFTPASVVRTEGGARTVSLHEGDDPRLNSESAELPGSLIIELHDTQGKEYLKMPVRAGDAIVVPVLGQVMVEGWVQKPGPYPITPHMTVSGAVAAAGGAVFAGDTTDVKVIRPGSNGGQGFFLVNLEGVEEGHAHDVPLQSADVVEVNASDVKIVPYGVYSTVTNLFRLSTYFPLF
jgi:polysaccharide export outer membrane protein